MSVVGIDIGGTHVRLVLMDRAGQVVARRTMLTQPERGPDVTINDIIATARHLAADTAARIEAVGIGVTGPVDVVSGIVSNPHTLAGWEPTDLRGPFTRALDVPVLVDNDANVAAVGEWWSGAAKGAARVVMVTVGTGIGVATLIDGHVQRNVAGQHGEAGHMVLDPAGPKCYCGASGCWEVLASGTALTDRSRLLFAGSDADQGETALGSATSEGLFAAARAGNAAAQRMIDEEATWLGLGLVNLAATVMPDVIVMSGGVMAHFDQMHSQMQRVMRQHSVMIPTDIPLRAALLGDDAGAIGAARQALGLLQYEGHA